MKNIDCLISVVVPLYNEECNVENFSDSIMQNFSSLDIQYELIFVDDGSIDDTHKKCAALASEYDNVSLISFIRNFGKEAAISAGLEFSKGDSVITIDGDFQHPISLISQMIEVWLSGDALVVNGVKRKRQKESLAYSTMSFLYYKAIGCVGAGNIANHSDYKLLDRKVVNALKRLPERNIFYRGIVPWLGYKSVNIEYDAADRSAGVGKWSTLQLFKYAVSSITSFTAAPLYFVLLLGLTTLLFAVFFGIYTLYIYFSGLGLDGFTTVILLILLMGSFVMIGMGILGLYLLNLFAEIKHRPKYILQESSSIYSKVDK